ncbi:hypothetical protein [Micromonospora sp. C51]|uniref:hypothetical protein n=1 Tax=Micromonospora sp. C51 TaxID=2824879 RepID=UPI0027DDA6B7|nr:hypothetical protein [Micromonospora sp. C51]
MNDEALSWAEVLSMIEHRLGMYVGRPRYDRAFAVVTGFDLARGCGELAGFQQWMSERHLHSPLTFWALVLAETFGDQADESRLVTDEDHQLAIGSLCQRLREFLNLSDDAQRAP